MHKKRAPKLSVQHYGHKTKEEKENKIKQFSFNK